MANSVLSNCINFNTAVVELPISSNNVNDQIISDKIIPKKHQLDSVADVETCPSKKKPRLEGFSTHGLTMSKALTDFNYESIGGMVRSPPMIPVNNGVSTLYLSNKMRSCSPPNDPNPSFFRKTESVYPYGNNDHHLESSYSPQSFLSSGSNSSSTIIGPRYPLLNSLQLSSIPSHDGNPAHVVNQCHPEAITLEKCDANGIIPLHLRRENNSFRLLVNDPLNQKNHISTLNGGSFPEKESVQLTGKRLWSTARQVECKQLPKPLNDAEQRQIAKEARLLSSIPPLFVGSEKSSESVSSQKKEQSQFSYAGIIQLRKENLSKKRKLEEQLRCWRVFLARWKEWKIEDFYAYLIRINDNQFAQYFPSLQCLKCQWNKHHSKTFQGEILADLDREDLNNLGVTNKEDRKLLFDKIRNLCEGGNDNRL